MVGMGIVIACVHLLAAVVLLALLAGVVVLALDATARVLVPTATIAAGAAGWFAVVVGEGYGVPSLPWVAAAVLAGGAAVWVRLRRARGRVVARPRADA